MALTREQQALKDAINAQNAAAKSGNKDAMNKAAVATAAAEKSAMSAGAAAERARASAPSSSSNKPSGGGYVAPTAAPKPMLADTVKSTSAQKEAQDWINQTYKGGLAAYVNDQTNKFRNVGNDTDLRSRLEADAARVGYQLGGVADNRSAREKYVGDRKLTDDEEKKLAAYEEELRTKGTARLPDFLQDASGNYQNNLMRANAEGFYHNVNLTGNDKTKSVAANNIAAINKAPSMADLVRNPGEYGYIPTAVGDYRGFEPGQELGGREAAFNWQTGELTGNAKLLDRNYNLAKDASRPESAAIRDAAFDNQYKELVSSGQLPDDEESKQWFYSLKNQWKMTDSGLQEGQALNATLASLISAQGSKPKEESPAAEAPAQVKAPATEMAYGARGEEVKALQKSLGIVADGIFGSQTANALKAYQAKNNLPVTGKADGNTLAALQNSAGAVNNDNQVKYLQDLVAKGGGNAEWAKKELARMGAGAPAAASAEAQPQTQAPAGGTDLRASALSALESGNLDAAMEAVNKRAAKIAGLKAQGVDVSAYEAQQAELVKAIEAARGSQVQTPASQYEEKMIDVIEKSQGDLDKMVKEFEKMVEESGDVELKEALSYEMARANAGAQLDPKYDEARTSLMDTLARDAAARGMYGQKPADIEMMKQVGNLENQRSADVATLANTLVGQSKEDAYREATFKQSQTQQRLANMLSVLQARGTLSQNTIANLQALINNENQKKAQATADKQLEASLFGTVDGKPTLAFQNMMKQWGYSDAEAARAAELFPLQKKQLEAQIAAANRSGRGSGGGDIPYDPQQDLSAIALKAMDFGLTYANSNLDADDRPTPAQYESKRREGERMYMERALPNEVYQAWLKDQGYAQKRASGDQKE